MLEKLVLRKAGTGGKKKRILQENKLGSVPVHLFGVCVCVCLYHVYMYCQRVHFEHVCIVCL